MIDLIHTSQNNVGSLAPEFWPMAHLKWRYFRQWWLQQQRPTKRVLRLECLVQECFYLRTLDLTSPQNFIKLSQFLEASNEKSLGRLLTCCRIDLRSNGAIWVSFWEPHESPNKIEDQCSVAWFFLIFIGFSYHFEACDGLQIHMIRISKQLANIETQPATNQDGN